MGSPWVGRPGVLLRGLRPQADAHNFQHELLNLRLIEAFKRLKLDPKVDAPPEELSCDVRQAIGHQDTGHLRSSAATLLSRYNYFRDRTFAPVELLMGQGFLYEFLNFEDFNELPPNFPLERIASERAKKRRKRSAGPNNQEGDAPRDDAAEQGEPQDGAGTVKAYKPRMRLLHVVLTELAGNMMCIPDLTTVLKATNLSIEDLTLWLEGPREEVFNALRSVATANEPCVTSFDPFTEDELSVRRIISEMSGGGDDQD